LIQAEEKHLTNDFFYADHPSNNYFSAEAVVIIAIGKSMLKNPSQSLLRDLVPQATEVSFPERESSATQRIGR